MIEFTLKVLYYHKMKITPSHYQLNKINRQHIRQSFFTLLLFCATLFFHSEHYVSVDADITVSVEPHDCHLCQQSLDTPPTPTVIARFTGAVSRVATVTIINPVLTRTEHLHPLLRAPPIVNISS